MHIASTIFLLGFLMISSLQISFWEELLEDYHNVRGQWQTPDNPLPWFMSPCKTIVSKMRSLDYKIQMFLAEFLQKCLLSGWNKCGKCMTEMCIHYFIIENLMLTDIPTFHKWRQPILCRNQSCKSMPMTRWTEPLHDPGMNHCPQQVWQLPPLCCFLQVRNWSCTSRWLHVSFK